MNKEVLQAAEVIKNGGVVAYPTDTVWGLGCDATNEEAVKKVYEIKQRSNSKALIVLVKDENQLQNTVKVVPDLAWDLIQFSEGPLTVIYPEIAPTLASNLSADDGSLAVRIVQDPFCIALLRLINVPLVSTSANIAGEPSPDTFSQIEEAVLNEVDYVVNWRRQDPKKNPPSKIVKVGLNGEFELIRK